MPIKKVFSLVIEFLKVWFFMFFTFLIVKFLCNLFVYGLIDLRRVAFLEVLFVPLGQSIAFWLIVKTFHKPLMKPEQTP